AAERRLHHRDRDTAIKVRPVPLEHRMRLDREEDVEVAGRTAAHAGLAFAGQANARAVLDAGRDVDGERPLARHAAGAGAFVARVVDRLAPTLTGWTGPLDGEKTLLGAHAP